MTAADFLPSSHMLANTACSVRTQSSELTAMSVCRALTSSQQALRMRGLTCFPRRLPPSRLRSAPSS